MTLFIDKNVNTHTCTHMQTHTPTPYFKWKHRTFKEIHIIYGVEKNRMKRVSDGLVRIALIWLWKNVNILHNNKTQLNIYKSCGEGGGIKGKEETPEPFLSLPREGRVRRWPSGSQ